MRKIFKSIVYLMTILFVMSTITCNQYKLDLEDFFSYWASVAKIESTNIEELPGSKKDSSGLFSIGSDGNQCIDFNLRNPKGFRIKEEGAISFEITPLFTSSIPIPPPPKKIRIICLNLTKLQKNDLR